MCAIKTHFYGVRDGLADLQFQRSSPFVPKHSAGAIIFYVAQSHRMGAGKRRAGEAGAKSFWIIKAAGLLMTSSTGRRIVYA